MAVEFDRGCRDVLFFVDGCFIGRKTMVMCPSDST
jgi:hypothetical protein